MFDILLCLNIAVFSAVVFYATKTLKTSLTAELRRIARAFRDGFHGKLAHGPAGLPYVGYLPFMAGRNPYSAFSDLAKQYGGMALVKLGKKQVLVLREPELIKEAYKMAAFSDRPNSSLKDDSIIGNKGIIQAVGDVWSEHRRLILASFRQLGLKTASSVTPSASHMSEAMQRCVEEYLAFIERSVVGKHDGHHMLERLTGRLAGSVISSCVFGLPKSFADEAFTQNVEIIEEGFQVGESIAPFEFLPVLKKVPGWWNRVEKKLKSNYCTTCKYFGGLIKEGTNKCEEPDSLDGLIAMYKMEMDRKSCSGDASILSEDQLRQTMTDLFCAGTETVKYSLMWGMLYMAENPEIQAKVQAELDAFYPDGSHLPKWEDLSSLPYTEATILEILRIRPVLPFGHPRAVHSYDTELRGKLVPKQTIVMSLIWDVHTDERYWSEPQSFQPSRFLTAAGKTFRPENFMPFGTGRRICLGDQMTMMEMFITFAALLRRYQFQPVGNSKVSLDWKILLSLLIPKNFEVDILPR